MATLSTLDVNTTSSAVVSWRWNEVTRFLAEPDPQIRDITFTTRFDNTATFFQLNIPIRIKGIKTSTTLILRIPPASISSFEVTTQSPAVPHAPIFDTRKRRRKDDGGEERDEDIALIWAQLEKIQTRHGLELKALREENLDLRDEVDDLRKRLAASEKSHQDLKEEFDALATRTDLRVDELGDEIDVKLIDTKSDIQELTESVKSLREDVDPDELVDRVKYKVFDHLRTSLSHDMSPAD